MSIKQAFLGAVSSSQLYADDVFSAYLRSGTSATATITNGIDLSTKGGLVITKARSTTTGWRWTDTARGATYSLDSSSTAAAATESTGLTAFNSNGYTIGADADYNNSTGPVTYVDFAFRKAPKFFDVVTFTAPSSGSIQVSHSLGVAPGMIVLKSTSNSDNWTTYHRSVGANATLFLNLTDAQSSATGIWSGVTSTYFTADTAVNCTANRTYVAYLFAHDTSADGIIQCGSFSGDAQIPLGWEPQFLIVKPSSTTGNWQMFDSMRGWTTDGNVANISANLSSAENATTTPFRPNATGFKPSLSVSDTYIYLAIRRPNKPPTSGTQVYNASTAAGNPSDPSFTSGFPVDLGIWMTTKGAGHATYIEDRLRGDYYLRSDSTAAEAADSLANFDVMTGYQTNKATGGYSWMFRRAPGVFETFCDTGTGSNKTETHGLGVAPELWLRKGRSGTTEWVWGSSLLANTEKIVMPSPNGKVTDATAWNSTYPTATAFSVGTAATTNTNAATYVTYLWATKAGISKVFSYTGDGGGKVIDCGFTAGARFIMIIRTTASTAQDIFIWDSARGIVAANDPHLSLNTTAAEVTTDDSIDPDNSGFAVNQVAATNINVNGAVYIGVAYA